MELFCMFEHTHYMGDKTFWECNDDNKLAEKG